MVVLLPFGLFAAWGQTPLPRAPASSEEERTLAPPINLAPPVSLDNLKERDKQLEALRAEQRKILEKEAETQARDRTARR